MIARLLFFTHDVTKSEHSIFEQTRLNGNDSYLSVSSEPLIKDEEPNALTTPKFTHLYTCSLT